MKPHVAIMKSALCRRTATTSVVRTAARAAGTVAASRLPTAVGSSARRPRLSERWSSSGKANGGVRFGARSFASPETDFTARADLALADRAFSSDGKAVGKSWSGTLSFDTPETDFAAQSSPEAVYTKEDFISYVQSSERNRNTMAYSLSFATPESDWTSPHVLNLLDERQRRQLSRCDDAAPAQAEEEKVPDEVVKYDTRRELLDEHPERHMDMSADEATVARDEEPQFHFEDVYSRIDSHPLPRNLAEATDPSEERPVVVTEARVPFRVSYVNSPWEGLCGYTLMESKGKTLGSLLQGPETDKPAVTALIDKLLHGEEAGTVLTNYSKDGRKFQNRLRVGALKNDRDQVTHFVGVLREIREGPDRFEGERTGRKISA